MYTKVSGGALSVLWVQPGGAAGTARLANLARSLQTEPDLSDGSTSVLAIDEKLDTELMRIGSNPQTAQAELRERTSQSIARSCQIPLALPEIEGKSSTREAYRLWLSTSIVPLAKVSSAN